MQVAPCFRSRLTFGGDSVSPPDFVSGSGRQSRDKTAHAGVSARAAYEYFVFHHERRGSGGCALFHVSELLIKEKRSGLAVKSHQVVVGGCVVHGIAEDGGPAIDAFAFPTAIRALPLAAS